MPRYSASWYECRMFVGADGVVTRKFVSCYEGWVANRMGKEQEISQQAYSKARQAEADCRVVVSVAEGVEVR